MLQVLYISGNGTSLLLKNEIPKCCKEHFLIMNMITINRVSCETGKKNQYNTNTCLTMISYKSGSAITTIAYGKIFAFTFVHAWLSLAFVDVY